MRKRDLAAPFFARLRQLLAQTGNQCADGHSMEGSALLLSRTERRARNPAHVDSHVRIDTHVSINRQLSTGGGP